MFGKSLPSRILPASPRSRASGIQAAGNGATESKKSVKIIVVSRNTRSCSAASRRNAS
jgi:hypothetical protein